MDSPLIVLFLLLFPNPSEQHARLMEPPSRASMWRVGFPTPRDIDDNQSYCGGYGVQYGSNGGKCGICGDPWHEQPRAHEAPNGIYATGIIAKTYNQGSFIPVIVDITANHQGYFIFKLCANNDIFSDPDQECFDKAPLWVGGGLKEHNHTRFPIADYETGLRMVYVRLPMEVTCEQCILQWTYVAGNNWGTCDDGTSGMGCGPQENFRSCSDIQIVRHPLLHGASSMGDNDDDSRDLYEESLLENELDEAKHNDKDDDDNFGHSLQKLASIRRKEALLRKKKQLLREVIKKLRELISQSQIFEENDQMASPQRTVSQFLPPPSSSNLDQFNDNDDGAKVRPWWDRIMSNRH